MRRRIYAGLARQLGHPSGLAGRVVGLGLNRGNRAAVHAAVDALGLPPGAVAADVGFGGGVGLARLLDQMGAGGRVHGVEVSAEMLERARRRFRDPIASGRLVLHDASLTELPFAAASVDGIVTTNTVYFVADLDQACAELARVLKPGGRVVVGIADPDVMARLPFTPYGFRIRPVAEVVGELERAGLSVQDRPLGGRDPRGFRLLVAQSS